MKKNMMVKAVAAITLGVCSLLAPFEVYSINPEVAAAEECTKELLLSYFPAPIVSDTLKKFNVPQDKWDGITKSLAQKDKEIVKTVEKKASEMSPNPLKDPQQRQAAVKLFRETLFEAFSSALKENGVTDTTQYQAMLDDIQQQKAKRFAMCMEKKKAEFQKAAPASTTTATDADADSDGDSDEDDDSDDSEDEDEGDEDADATAPATTTPATN